MKAITPKDVLIPHKEKGKWLYQGRELTKGEVENLKQEADLIAKTALWKLMVNEGKYHAQKRAIECKPDELEKVQEFHKVLTFFEQYIHNFIKAA